MSKTLESVQSALNSIHAQQVVGSKKVLAHQEVQIGHVAHCRSLLVSTLPKIVSAHTQRGSEAQELSARLKALSGDVKRLQQQQPDLPAAIADLKRGMAEQLEHKLMNEAMFSKLESLKATFAQSQVDTISAVSAVSMKLEESIKVMLTMATQEKGEALQTSIETQLYVRKCVSMSSNSKFQIG